MVRLELSSCTANALIFLPVRPDLSSGTASTLIGYGQNSHFREWMSNTVQLKLLSGTASTLICIPDIPRTAQQRPISPTIGNH